MAAFVEVAFDAFVAHGPQLFVGVTVVLALGLLWTRTQRTAAARRRLGIGTAAACGLYLALAALPLPRFVPTTTEVDRPPVAAATATAGALPHGVSRAEVITALGLIDEPSVLATARRTPVSHSDQPTAAPTRVRAASATTWPRAIAWVYLASAALLLAHQLLGLLRLGRIVRLGRPAAATARALADLPPATRLLFARCRVRPFCAGWLRPIVVLSPDLEHRPALLAAVLRHEAAHLRARDPLVQVLFALLAVPLVLHPLFWWLRADVRFQSELLADERAAGNHRTDYARELLDLVDRPAPLVATVGTIAVFHRPSAFYRRIQMLLQPNATPSRPHSRLRRTGQLAAMLMLVATTAGVLGVPATAQDPGRAQTALEAESRALRAQIAEMRQQIADLSAELQRNAERLPINPLTGLPGSDQPVPPKLPGTAKIVHGRLDTVTGRVTPSPTPGDNKGSEATPPPTEGIPPAAQAPAGTLRPSPIPTFEQLFQNRRSVPGTTTSDPGPGARAGDGHVSTGMASTAEGTVELTSRLLDLDTEIEIAKAKREHTQALAKRGMISDGELHADEARLKNVMRKRDIVRNLVEFEIKATETEIAWMAQRMRRAKKNTGEHLQIEIQMQRAEGRLQALRAAR